MVDMNELICLFTIELRYEKGKSQVLAVTFHTDNGRYNWLNDVTGAW